VENCHDIWNLEYEEHLPARVKAKICKRISGERGSNGTSASLNEQNYVFSVVKGTKIII
jgi:hypothetical protein